MPVDHYENFPVASLLLPRRLRRPIELIYAFARQADDFADEGNCPAKERLAQLNTFRMELDKIAGGEQAGSELFRDITAVIREYKLPLALFYDLLDAFSQDVVKTRYANFGEVMDYCRRSANPIGRLLLHLYKETDARSMAYSDAICSSLQLINFLQDVAVDFAKDRIYLPQDEMARFGIDESRISRGDASGPWQPFMQFQIERTRKLLQAGAPLGKTLRGRIGLEMRMIIMGGEVILRKLHKHHGNMFQHRPVLRTSDWVYMLYRAARAK